MYAVSIYYEAMVIRGWRTTNWQSVNKDLKALENDDNEEKITESIIQTNYVSDEGQSCLVGEIVWSWYPHQDNPGSMLIRPLSDYTDHSFQPSPPTVGQGWVYGLWAVGQIS
jgi:hypothetical protein